MSRRTPWRLAPAAAVLLALLFASPAALWAGPIPDGIYLETRDTSASLVKTQSGREVRLGLLQALKIRKADVISLNNGNTEFLVQVTVPYDPTFPRSCALAVAGTVYGLTGAGSSMDQWSSLSFVVAGEGNAKEVANYFGVQPALRKHPGYDFLVSCTPSKSEFVVGEAVEVTLRVRNLGPQILHFNRGGTYHTGRDNRFVFAARLGGKALPDIGNSTDAGGLSFPVALASGETFECGEVLTKWFSFEKPGTYRIHGAYHFDFRTGAGSPDRTVWEDYASADFTVTIKAAPEATRESVGPLR